MTATVKRRPRRVYANGDEPDPRFSLANERTLLAWLRTALALVLAGIAIVALSELVGPTWPVTATAGIALIGGAAASLIGYRHWERAERALRCAQPLPSGSSAVFIVGVILVMVALGAVGLVLTIGG